MTRLIEEGLRLRLQPKPVNSSTVTAAIKLPTLPSKKGQGLQPGINPLSNKSLYDAADGLSS